MAMNMYIGRRRYLYQSMMPKISLGTLRPSSTYSFYQILLKGLCQNPRCKSRTHEGIRVWQSCQDLSGRRQGYQRPGHESRARPLTLFVEACLVKKICVRKYNRRGMYQMARRGLLTRIEIERNPLARNVVEIKVIRLLELHITGVPDRETFFMVARMKSEIEKAIVLARLPQRKEVIHLKHGGL